MSEGGRRRRRTQGAALTGEERYREVFDSVSDALFVVDVSAVGRFRFDTMNPTAERVTGLKAADLRGRWLEDVVRPEMVDHVLPHWRQCVASGAPVQYTDDYVRRVDGARLHLLTTIVPIRDAAGSVRRLLVVGRDVTEQKDAEEATRRSLAEIEDLYNNAPCGYHSLDASGTYVRVNDTELRWLGYRREEMVGKIRLPDLLTPANLESFQRQFEQVKEGGSVRDVELEMIRKDGSVLPAMISATALRDASGRFVMTRATLVDLTDRRKVEEQLRQAQKLDAVGRLAGGLAHDFNNVLTVILSASADILEKMIEGHPLREDVLAIDVAARRAAALTQQILTFSRRQQVQPRVLDLDRVIDGMEKMFRRILGEDILLARSSDGGRHRVRADPGQIEQVLLNLAVNARDAMPAGGRLSVETQSLPAGDERERALGLEPGDHVVLTVRDNGAGMEPATVAHLFEPFFTTKERGKGTGLGLSTVYGIVKQGGGEVRVETAPGKGSAFLVCLPAASNGVEPVAAEPVAGPLPRGSETVLVTEDEPQVRALVVRCLRGLGYTVLEAGDGEEAMGIATGAVERIGLLITDAVMPRMGGAELAGRLRAIRSDIPVLFFSGYVAEGGPLPSGPGFGFLQKPFTPALLARRVRDLLDGCATTPR